MSDQVLTSTRRSTSFDFPSWTPSGNCCALEPGVGVTRLVGPCRPRLSECYSRYRLPARRRRLFTVFAWYRHCQFGASCRAFRARLEPRADRDARSAEGFWIGGPVKLVLSGMTMCLVSACAEPAQDDVATVEEALLPNDGGHNKWILEPEDMPPGHFGTNNCTFAFGAVGCDLTVHPDTACWEREAGHDGWIRQQNHRVHCAALSDCGGGPGDAYNIRLCRAPGEMSPCGMTGPIGCAVCVRASVCGE